MFIKEMTCGIKAKKGGQWKGKNRIGAVQKYRVCIASHILNRNSIFGINQKIKAEKHHNRSFLRGLAVIT
jgi:hypothetical protein